MDTGEEGSHYSLDWTTGLTFDLKCSIYVKKIMFYLCEKNYIDRAHGFFAQVQYSIAEEVGHTSSLKV